MNCRAESRYQKAEMRLDIFKKVFLISALCSLISEFSVAADTLPRIFFSDANISFTVPNHWDLQPHFPYGPLFSKGSAQISCVISAPLSDTHMTADMSQDVLKGLAMRELQAHQPGYQALEEQDRQVSGHNAFAITWENVVDSQTLRNQTVYFYVANRVYAMTLQSSPKTFKWVAPDFKHWLTSLRILSREDTGALQDPAHGGLWIHQTGGLKISVPENWLIAVSDDRLLGAAIAQDTQHAMFTATVDLSTPGAKSFRRRDRKEAYKLVHGKGLRIVQDAEDAFHGLPGYKIQYEGMLKDRVVKGIDIWVLSPKGRWLFNVEGDVTLYNSLTAQIEQILNNIEFI
jgi:hypothetical protein